MPCPPKRIVLATIGSLGDLHPCLALALGLRARGHQPVIASTEIYRGKVEALDIEFCAIRPDVPAHDPAVIAKLMHMRRGPEFLLRSLILPSLKDTYTDLVTAVGSADLLIAGEIVFAAPLVAEKLRMQWVSVILSPFSFYSSYDPPVSPYAPSLAFLHGAWRQINSAILHMGKLATNSWWEPVRRLRRDLGLSPGRNALFHDKFSTDLTLALFSPEFARRQPDWASNTVQPGFVYYDSDEARVGLPPELTAFLDAGEPPIVFTLGSTAVHAPRRFYAESAAAARLLNRRAVFLTGENPPPAGMSELTLALPYAPFSELFPRAAVVVHQGGVGSTAQGLRAGRPALIMPCGFDQPDNAARVQRLGAGISISRRRYRARSVARALETLLQNPGYAATAARIGEQLRAEDGLGKACDAIEQLFSNRRTA